MNARTGSATGPDAVVDGGERDEGKNAGEVERGVGSDDFPREIVLVAAMAENRVIGVEGALPWHLSADLKRFKAMTTGASIVMGRKTYESFGSRPLPRRRNHVVSRSPGVDAVSADGSTSTLWHHSLENALRACGRAGEGTAFVVGGGQIYEAALCAGLATRVELTRVFLKPAGDAHFPLFEDAFRLASWEDREEGGIAFRYESWLRRESVHAEP